MSITFETQEDFENAVMEVLQKRLTISVRVGSAGNCFSEKDGVDVYVCLSDYYTGDDITADSDSVVF